jgi:hypothetical protein
MNRVALMHTKLVMLSIYLLTWAKGILLGDSYEWTDCLPDKDVESKGDSDHKGF